MIEAKFNFHPVGQGCFYSGKISWKGTHDLNFDFVYDCGTVSTKSYLDSEVDQYKKDLQGTCLDVLIISHFDEDHVNGVVRLLKGIHCKRIIIPYYEPIERLLLYLRTNNKDAEYGRFLQNPISFLSDSDQFDIDEIIIVGGPDNPESSLDFIPVNLFPKKRLSVDEASEKLKILEELPFNADLLPLQSDNPITKEFQKNELFVIDISKVKLLPKPYKININIWEFIFYLKKHDHLRLIKKFTEEVNQFLAFKKLSFFDLFVEKNTKVLRGIYKNHYTQNLNSTSLVTFHTPLVYAGSDKIRLFGLNWCNEDRNFGTLLTGDIDLKSKNKVANMLKYFGPYMRVVSLFQVPHHGAILNWPKIHPNRLEDFCNYIINHGYGRKHHPSPDVIHYIKTHCQGDIHLNNEVESFKYGFTFHK